MLQDTSATPIDGELTKAPGTVEDSIGTGTLEWGTPSGAKKFDNEAAEAFLESGVVTHYLKATNFGFALPGGATVLGIKARIVSSGGANAKVVDNRVRIVKGGAIKEAVDHASGAWSSAAEKTYGAVDDLWGQTWSAADINASTFGVAFSVSGTATNTFKVDVIYLTVAYAEGGNLNRVCFASRSVEFSDSGDRRQHVTDEVWGELIPDGLDLQAPVPGQDDQPMRVMVVPSVGDFESRPDSATGKLTAKLYYRPAYLSAREAK